jgi:DNA-binding phage protein
MALTRDFREIVMARVRKDPEFRSELIVEATNALLEGDVETGKGLLRDYLNATESLPAIASELNMHEKSIRRMLGPKGNPTLKNFIGILKACTRMEDLKLEICQH